MSRFHTDPHHGPLALNAATARDLKARAPDAPDLVPIDADYFMRDGNTFVLIGKARKALDAYGRAHPAHRDEMARRAAELSLRLPMPGSDLSDAEFAALNDGAPRTQDTALTVLMEYIDPISDADDADDDSDDEWDDEDEDEDGEDD